MAPKRSITERLTGSIELEDQELIDEILESEDWLGELSELWEEAIYPDSKTKDLTPEERKHVEESMRRHDTLMRRLSKM
jgi:hypothetical protein